MSVKEIVNRYGIAPWKIDSAEEELLSIEADKSEHDRKVYVDYYKEHDAEYYNRGIEFIDQAIKTYVGGVSEEKRQSYIEDMVYSLHRFGCMFDEYFMFDFEHLNVAGREQYITDKNRWEFYNRFNNYKNNSILHNKYKEYTLFKQYYKRDVIQLSSFNDYGIFKDFINYNEKIIVKPVDGTAGRGISVYKTSDYDSKCLFEKIICKQPVVCEQVVENETKIQALHSTSLNTVRIPIIRTKNGAVPFYPMLRMGCNNSVVDNSSAGGIVAPIDAATGIVIAQGRQKKTGKTFLYHPDSNILLPGFRIPRWSELLELMNEISEVVPDNHYCGWDMALTKDGWVMIEGNPEGQLSSIQLVFQKGLRDELEKLLALK